MQVNFERAIAQLMKRWEEMTKGEKPLHVEIITYWPNGQDVKYNESSLVPEMFEKIIPEQELEIDVVVRIPPIRERSVRVKVKTVEKAVPNIVGPGAF